MEDEQDDAGEFAERLCPVSRSPLVPSDDDTRSSFPSPLLAKQFARRRPEQLVPEHCPVKRQILSKFLIGELICLYHLSTVMDTESNYSQKRYIPPEL